MNLPRLTALALLALPVSLCAQAPDVTVGGAAGTITEEDFVRRIGVMAHDSMQGRDTPSPGLEKTTAWIASQFEEMGLRGGAADGTFVQRYPLRATVVDEERSTVTRGDARLELGADWLPLLGEVLNGESTAPLAVVSGAGDVPDDAVRGRHAVLVPSATSGGLDQTLLRTLRSLIGGGAASVLVVNPTGDAEWSASAVSLTSPEVYRAWVGAGTASERPFLPVLQIRPSAAEALMSGSGLDLAALQARWARDLRVDAVSGAEATVALRYDEREIGAPNVVGVLEGSDPMLRDEYVVLSAHMDHVGVGTPDENGDSVFNGADDNASGTTAVIEVAEAMAALATAPRRSMMFLLVSGEEKGLWGSEYFAANPPVPVDAMVADVNMDMVGRNWPDTIVAIGKEHSDLGATLERVNRAHPELGMTAIDDLWPEENFYFRSDHYNFAREGVPVLFFFNGVHEDYHGRDDEPGRIDAEKAARVAKLVFYLGIEVANADDRPEWNPASYRSIVQGR